jgi:hypothetical protein
MCSSFLLRVCALSSLCLCKVRSEATNPDITSVVTHVRGCFHNSRQENHYFNLKIKSLALGRPTQLKADTWLGKLKRKTRLPIM